MISGLVISEQSSFNAFDVVLVNIFFVVDIVSVVTCVNYVIYLVSFNTIGVALVDIRESDVVVCL